MNISQESSGEKIFVVIFKNESEAYQAFDEIKKDMDNENYTAHRAILVKKVEGQIVPCENCEAVCRVTTTALGGLVGMIVGALGGPLGIALGGAAGSVISNKIVSHHIQKAETCLETVSKSIQDKEIALIALVEEKIIGTFANAFSNYNVEIQEKDAALVAEEVEAHMDFQKKLDNFDKKIEHDKKIEFYKDQIATKRAVVQDEISAIREGMKIVHDEMEAYTK